MRSPGDEGFGCQLPDVLKWSRCNGHFVFIVEEDESQVGVARGVHLPLDEGVEARDRRLGEMSHGP